MAIMPGVIMSLSIVKGDNLRLIFELRDESGASVISAGAAEIRWAVSTEYGAAVVIDKRLSLGSVIQSGPYTFFVDIEQADTATLNAGRYRQEVEITTSGGLVYTCLQADFIIKPTSI